MSTNTFKKTIENSEHDMLEEKIKNLPQKPGIYFFKDKKGDFLYIGKATNLRSRVSSYFHSGIEEKRGPLIQKMVEEVDDVEVKKTDNAIEALILEAHKIKEFQPKYNTKEKSGKSFVYLVITKEDFPKIIIKREKEIMENKLGKIKIWKSFGPFSSRKNLERSLQVVRKIFPYYSQANSYASHSNLYEQVGLAPNSTDSKAYRDNIKNIALFFEGKKNTIIKNLEKEMMKKALEEEFEKAEFYKHKIFSLKHISDFTLNFLEEDNFFSQKIRIEAYDIAHMQGDSHVGVMTVVENGEKNSSEYRKFKIKSFEGIDDNRSLREVLERRFSHSKWAFPDIIVADGGVAQKRTVEKFLREKNLQKDIAVVSCKKNKNHKVVSILGKKEISSRYQKEILLANAESHRFAISYHRKKRDAEFIFKI